MNKISETSIVSFKRLLLLARNIKKRMTSQTIVHLDAEALLERFYRQLDLDSKIVIDIGAHRGRHAIPLSEKVGDCGAVIAFEPIPDIRHSLSETLFQKEINNIALMPFALSDHSGSESFVFLPQTPEESGLKRRAIYNSKTPTFKTIKVAVKTLDELFSHTGEIGLIKIDVEGGELDVLRGASEILAAQRPIIAFESGAAAYSTYHTNPEEIFDIFSRLAYRVYSIHGDEITTREEFLHTNTVQNFWDYIALPEGRSALHKLLLLS